jgi:SAM-dependent methyltransferase
MTESRNTAPNAAVLSPFLSRLRHKLVRKKMPDGFKPSNMLDIGCGVYPKLIMELEPELAAGIDIRPKPEGFPEHVDFIQQDLSQNPKLAFADNSFDMISALAVLEHIEPEALISLFSEIKRVLKPGGLFVATMPSGIGDHVLHFLAFFGLASKTNLEEHKDRYNCRKVRSMMQKAGFETDELDIGRFEFGMNIYAKAVKA